MTLSIKINSKGARDAINLAAKDLRPELLRGMLKATQHTTGVVRSQIYETFPGGRTGGLARSFNPVFLGVEGKHITTAVFSKLSYARIQDEGGIIKPKSVSKLAVPLSSARVPVGKWPRHFAKGELVYIKTKSGKELLAKISKKGGIKPVFVLKPSVRLRARNYIEAARRRAEPAIVEILDGQIAIVTKKASGG